MFTRGTSTDAPYPSDRCVHELFEAQVVNTPDAIALVHEDRTMTYCQLNHHANRLARQLVAADVQHGDNVAMMLERSFELIVSQLAIVKVGAAYVPIDVKAPLDRQMYIASDSGAKLLITNESREIPVQLDVTVLRFHVDDENTVDEQGMYFEVVEMRMHRKTGDDGTPTDHTLYCSLLSLVGNLDLPCSSIDTAYIMYTSGSTGRPKGVMVPHRGIARLVINNGMQTLDC